MVTVRIRGPSGDVRGRKAAPTILLLAMVALGCTHSSHARTHASARLTSLIIVSSKHGDGVGQLQLVARYHLDGLPFGSWHGESAQLTLSVNDVPFAAVLAEPRVLPGDIV